MGDLDADTLADAARRYSGLRWRYWRFALGFVLGFAAFVVIEFLFGLLEEYGPPLGPVIRDVPWVLVVFGCLTCWVGGLVTWSSLMRFRCPRCGGRFILSWAGSWPTDRCKHCLLDLGPVAMATAKPPPVLDL